MPENKQLQFLEYIDTTLRSASQQEQEFIMDERRDEADHIRIGMNIMNIFKTTFLTVSKRRSEEEYVPVFIEKMKSIPKNWSISYENAKLHHDTQTMLIEEIKLQTLAQIQAMFYKIWEVIDDRNQCNQII